jgi:hypothetical protein
LDQSTRRVEAAQLATISECGCCESFNGKLRDEFLNGEIFYSLKEVAVITGVIAESL